MSPLSLMRSVAAQATRGGRSVVSRRNFSSPSVCKETKVAGNRGRKGFWNAVGGLSTGFLIGFIALDETATAEKEELRKELQEKYLRESSAENSSELPLASSTVADK